MRDQATLSVKIGLNEATQALSRQTTVCIAHHSAATLSSLLNVLPTFYQPPPLELPPPPPPPPPPPLPPLPPPTSPLSTSPSPYLCTRLHLHLPHYTRHHHCSRHRHCTRHFHTHHPVQPPPPLCRPPRTAISPNVSLSFCLPPPPLPPLPPPPPPLDLSLPRSSEAVQRREQERHRNNARIEQRLADWTRLASCGNEVYDWVSVA